MLNKCSYFAVIILSGLWGSVALANAGPYLGAQIGYGITRLDDTQSTQDLATGLLPGNGNGNLHTDKHYKDVAGRAYAGYMFNSYLGTELGFSKFHNASTDTTAMRGNGNGNAPRSSVSSTNSASAIDAMAVFALPVNRLTFNAKAGVAYVMNHYRVGGVSSQGNNPMVASDSADFKTRKFRPKFGAGVDYAFTDKVSLGVAYDIILGRGQPFNVDSMSPTTTEINTNGHYTPRLQLVSANLKYNF